MFPTAPASPASAQPEPLEDYLSSLLPSAELAPQALHRAMRHAVFPGGKRIRPTFAWWGWREWRRSAPPAPDRA